MGNAEIRKDCNFIEDLIVTYLCDGVSGMQLTSVRWQILVILTSQHPKRTNEVRVLFIRVAQGRSRYNRYVL